MQVEWQTTDGRTATVNVEIVRDASLATLSITAWVAGVMVGSGKPVAIKHPVAVAAIGKLAMAADRLALVNDAIVGAQAEYAAALATERQVAADRQQYAADYARIANA